MHRLKQSVVVNWHHVKLVVLFGQFLHYCEWTNISVVLLLCLMEVQDIGTLTFINGSFQSVIPTKARDSSLVGGEGRNKRERT